MIEREQAAGAIARALKRQRVVVLSGPRQCGKTTLARQVVDPVSSNYFDLENPGDVRRLDEPMTALSGLSGTVVIDEVQRRPELFPILRVLADRDAPLLGTAIPPAALLRFWTMVAHWHGGIWNAADPARSLGVSDSTVRRYLEFQAV